MNLLYQLLDAPYTDPDTHRRARLLNTLLVGIGGLSILALLAVLLLEGNAQEETLLFISVSIVLIGIVIIFVINRYGSQALAGWLFVGLLVLAIAFGDTPEEIVSGRSLFTLTIPILMASVLLRPHSSFIIAGLTSLLLIVISANANLGFQAIPALGFFGIAFIAWLSARSLERAVVEVRTVNQELDERVTRRTKELKESNAQLHQEILERKHAEQELQAYRDQLERTVAARTGELETTNEQLHQEIIQHEETTRQLTISLQEKEILLKEVHHRVKNNLQVISSLLDLQSGSIADEGLRDILQQSRNRVHSMAMVHQQLYQSQNFTQIDAADYIRELVSNLIIAHSSPTKEIDFHMDLASVPIKLDTAVPCGLIINELVNNALQHAFPDNREGQIWIDLQKGEAHQCTVQIKDDGIGLPPDFDIHRAQSMGLTIVNAMVEQLRGEMDVHSDQGTEFRITLS